MNEYGVETKLRDWFMIMQGKFNECHVSCAGRDEKSQTEAFNAGRSLAEFGQSPHNFTPAFAIDLFRIDSDGHAHFEMEWYKENLVPEMPKYLTWGGTFKSRKTGKSFPDGPHFEITGWSKMPRVKIWNK